jgi:hypothetical protein
VARRRRPVVYSLRWPSALFRLLELGGGGRERIWELSWVGNNNEREREREKTQQLPLWNGSSLTRGERRAAKNKEEPKERMDE